MYTYRKEEKDKPAEKATAAIAFQGALDALEQFPKAPISAQKQQSNAATTSVQQPAQKAPTTSAYKPSETVTQAQTMLQQQMAQKPGAYQSTWEDQLHDTINQILNRDKFSHDLNGDALYQQYADQYIQQGKMAMMDTMGQAQAMTGGYGNSYAQTAGQQAYQGYLQQLNEVVPELYVMALDRYNQEGQELYNQAALIGQQEDQDYGRYQDALNRWQAERDYLTGRLDSERDYDYGKYADERDFAYESFLNDRNFQYQKDRDAVSDKQYGDQMGLAKEQWEWEKEQAKLQKAAAQSGTEGNDILLWRETGTYDNDGNRVFINSDGKTQSFGEGVNPYTGTKNPDAQNGTFSNGYQPNNVASYYGGDAEAGKLTKTAMTDVVNGKTQNVWQTPDGKLWIWDGTQNRYLQYDDGQREVWKPQKSSSVTAIAGQWDKLKKQQ
jgi:hypothetical protein